MKHAWQWWTVMVLAAAVPAAVGCGESSTEPQDRATVPPHDDSGADNGDDASPDESDASGGAETPAGCDPGNGGIALPDGFCASVFADDLGRARHLTVTPSGDVYVAIAPARDSSDPGHVVALRDDNGDGHADAQVTFGELGGNGILWADGTLYLAANDRIVRWMLPAGTLAPADDGMTVVRGLPADGDHPAKSVVMAPDGHLFLNHGSASNSCQLENRVLHSRGKDPCPELAVRAGIFHVDPEHPEQHADTCDRYATGLRNTNALAIDPSTGHLWGAVNGRDQLHENWPELFTEEEDLQLPGEELVRIDKGDDFGWPYCYWDPAQGRKVLAPEYGGDGTIVGRCASAEAPALSFPAHWAPLAMHFYTGEQFPEAYRHGAFVTMHGSRFEPSAEEPPGYNVVFVPFSAGAPTGTWSAFASGFAGERRPLPEMADHRPVGLAQAPDGSLYVSDDVGGRIWRIRYVGN